MEAVDKAINHPISKEVKLDMALNYLNEVTALDNLTPVEVQELNHIRNRLDNLLSINERFVCLQCSFKTDIPKEAALHKHQKNNHFLSGPQGWVCICGYITGSHHHSKVHLSARTQTDGKPQLHRIFRFNNNTLKKTEKLEINFRYSEEFREAMIKHKVNTEKYCPLERKVRLIKSLDLKKCSSCKHHKNNNGGCLPVYPLPKGGRI